MIADKQPPSCRALLGILIFLSFPANSVLFFFSSLFRITEMLHAERIFFSGLLLPWQASNVDFSPLRRFLQPAIRKYSWRDSEIGFHFFCNINSLSFGSSTRDCRRVLFPPLPHTPPLFLHFSKCPGLFGRGRAFSFSVPPSFGGFDANYKSFPPPFFPSFPYFSGLLSAISESVLPLCLPGEDASLPLHRRGSRPPYKRRFPTSFLGHRQNPSLASLIDLIDRRRRMSDFLFLSLLQRFSSPQERDRSIAPLLPPSCAER